MYCWHYVLSKRIKHDYYYYYHIIRYLYSWQINFSLFIFLCIFKYKKMYTQIWFLMEFILI